MSKAEKRNAHDMIQVTMSNAGVYITRCCRPRALTPPRRRPHHPPRQTRAEKNRRALLPATVVAYKHAWGGFGHLPGKRVVSV